MARESASIFSQDIVLAAIRDSFPKLDPRMQVAQPGDVHRRDRQRDHDR